MQRLSTHQNVRVLPTCWPWLRSAALALLIAVSLPGCGSDEAAVEGCQSDNDCRQGERCAAGVCSAVRCGCTAVWAPVCGDDGATYANECEAGCVGAAVETFGACQVGCLDDADCLPDQRCATTEACTPSPDCDPDQPCAEVCYGQCVDTGCACPPEGELVCGGDGVTYGNECLARCGGVEPTHQGPCASCTDLEPTCGIDCPAGLTTGADGCPTCECEVIACGANGACPEGWLCDTSGCEVCPDCPDCRPTCIPAPTCTCTPGNDPVCGVNGGTYESQCVAECAGVVVAHPGPCAAWCDPLPDDCALECPWGYATDPDGCLTCECSTEIREVCSDSRQCGSGMWCNPEACAPSCAGCLDCNPACEPTFCDCSDVWEPVCDETGWTYASACEASCAGVDNARLGTCGSQCQCGASWAPVCGVDGVTYANACEAECAGAQIEADGQCECLATCVNAEPVCGADGRTYTCGATEAACNNVGVRWSGTCDAPHLCNSNMDCGPDSTCDPEACAPECSGCPGCSPACRPG